MEQKTLNERIAMALLRQCALVWEHCVSTDTNYIDGKCSLSDVKRGAYGKQANRRKSKIGMVYVEDPKWPDVFDRKIQEIDGVSVCDGFVRLTVDGFSCGYCLEKVFEVAYDFCRMNDCSRLSNKMVFGWDNGERYAVLPEVHAKTEKAVKNETDTASTIELAERLRQALLAMAA